MSTPPRRFEVVAPDLRLPMLVVGLTVMGCIGAAYFGWRAFPGGMRIGVLILLAVVPLALTVSVSRRRVELADGMLHVVAGLAGTRVAVSKLLAEHARIVDLDQAPQERIGIKLFGVAMPGYHAGHFREIGGHKVFALVTDRRRVLVLPERGGRLLMLSLQRPQSLLDALGKS